MKATRVAIIAMLGFILNAQCAHAVELGMSVQLKDAVPAELDPDAPLVVIVDQQTHLTHALQYRDEILMDVFTIPNATGKAATPTPNCRAKIVQKELNPSWKPPVSIDPKQKVIPPFRKTHCNPLGLANLRLNIDHGMIGLHGTNEPKRIGQSVSHGCIRHLNKDIVALYKMVHVGTLVYIVARTDDATVPVCEFQSLNSVAKEDLYSSVGGIHARDLSAI